jgi:hypothetical protein
MALEHITTEVTVRVSGGLQESRVFGCCFSENYAQGGRDTDESDGVIGVNLKSVST